MVGIGLGWVVYLVVAWSWPDLGLRSISFAWGAFGMAMAVAGSILTLVTAKLLTEREWARQLVGFGQVSLTIMVAHKFLILPVQVAFYRVVPHGEGLVAGWSALLFAVAVAWGIVYGLTKVAKVVGWREGKELR